MKELYLFKNLFKTKFIFYALFMFICAIDYAQQIWQKVIDFDGNTDVCFKIIETSHQKYVLCGASTKPAEFGWGFDGFVASLTSDGQLEWSQKFGSMGTGAQNDFLFDIIQNEQGDLIATGIYKKGNQSRKLWLLQMRLSDNGIAIISSVEKYFGDTDKHNGGAKIIQNPDQTYYVIGFTESLGTQQGGCDAWLLKLNQNLDTLWTKTYDFGFEDHGAILLPFQDKFLFIINSITGLINQFPIPPYYTSFTTILLIDSMGNVHKSHTFNQSTIQSFSNATITADGGAVLVGSSNIQDNNLGGRDVFIVKLNNQADLEWTKLYGGYGKYDGGTDIIEFEDGSFLVSAYSQTQYTSSVDNWWLLRLNHQGDTMFTLWPVVLPLNDDPASMLKSNDGYVVIAGWINANSNPANAWNMGNADICVVKFDSSLQQIVQFHERKITLYPNPAQNAFYIFSDHVLHNVIFEIYDIKGLKLCVFEKLNGIHFTIQPHNLSDGCYLVVLKTPTGQILYKNVVVFFND